MIFQRNVEIFFKPFRYINIMIISNFHPRKKMSTISRFSMDLWTTKIQYWEKIRLSSFRQPKIHCNPHRLSMRALAIEKYIRFGLYVQAYYWKASISQYTSQCLYILWRYKSNCVGLSHLPIFSVCRTQDPRWCVINKVLLIHLLIILMRVDSIDSCYLWKSIIFTLTMRLRQQGLIFLNFNLSAAELAKSVWIRNLMRAKNWKVYIPMSIELYATFPIYIINSIIFHCESWFWSSSRGHTRAREREEWIEEEQSVAFCLYCLLRWTH